MSIVDDLADKLARDTIAAMAELGDERLHEEVAKVVGTSSPTLQEAFMTSVRIRLAEQRGRRFLEGKVAAGRKPQE